MAPLKPGPIGHAFYIDPTGAPVERPACQWRTGRSESFAGEPCPDPAHVPTRGKNAGRPGKYCKRHASEARAAWRDNRAAERAERDERDARYAAAWADAQAAGRAAAVACDPVPMIVEGYEHAPVLDGMCGFAWVHFTRADSRFAHWLKRNGYAEGRAYRGGLDVWVRGYGQSHARKLAHANAAAAVLAERLTPRDLRDGTVYGDGRLD